jgi:hypothetical protein
MANLAFQKTDSLLIHKIIKGEKLATDQATGTVTMKAAFIQWTHLLYVLRWVHLDRHLSGHRKDEDVRFIELYQLRTRRSIYLQCPMVKE